MAIKPVLGYVGGVPVQTASPKPVVFPKPKPYNPLAYVPGGAPAQVAQAIQKQGLLGVPKVSIPQASSIVQPYSGGGGGAAGAAAGGGTAGGSTDPYGDELRADRMFGIGQQNYQDALDMGERTLLHDPINQLLMQYGYDPRSAAGVPQNLADLASKYLDPAALDAAKANPYTTANQIGKTFTDALNVMPYQLAARGVQNSGAANIIGSNLNYQRGLSDKQAIDQLLSGLGTANQNWTDFQTTQANAWRQAQEDIATRLAQQAGYHGGDGAVGTGTGTTGGDGAIGTGTTGPVNTDDPLYSFDASPYLNPSAPSQVYTPVSVGSSTSFEPKPTADNYAQQKVSPATAKVLAKVKATTTPSPMWKALNMGKLGL